jgi:hypothetical protein
MLRLKDGTISTSLAAFTGTVVIDVSAGRPTRPQRVNARALTVIGQ